MKVSLIHHLDSITDMETGVKTYGMPWLHDNQWNEDLKSNSYLQLHFHGIDAHHFILEERKNITIQKEDKHVTDTEILNCSSASGAKFHLDAQLSTISQDFENLNKWTAKKKKTHFTLYFFNVASTMFLQMLKHSYYDRWAHCFSLNE